jgi:hypothetical protein
MLFYYCCCVAGWRSLQRADPDRVPLRWNTTPEFGFASRSHHNAGRYRHRRSLRLVKKSSTRLKIVFKLLTDLIPAGQSQFAFSKTKSELSLIIYQTGPHNPRFLSRMQIACHRTAPYLEEKMKASIQIKTCFNIFTSFGNGARISSGPEARFSQL